MDTSELWGGGGEGGGGVRGNGGVSEGVGAQELYYSVRAVTSFTVLLICRRWRGGGFRSESLL